MERAITRLGRYERQLWLLGIVFYGIGDTVTTFAGLSVGGVAEAGPIARPAIDAYGQAALLAIKLVVFSLFYVSWRLVDRPTRVAIPLALAVVGVLVTGWNLVTIATAV